MANFSINISSNLPPKQEQIRKPAAKPISAKSVDTKVVENSDFLFEAEEAAKPVVEEAKPVFIRTATQPTGGFFISNGCMDRSVRATANMQDNYY